MKLLSSTSIGAVGVTALLLIAFLNWLQPATFSADEVTSTLMATALALGYGLIRQL